MFNDMISRFADRMVMQSRDLFAVACKLDETDHPLADKYSQDATRYAVAAGYLRSRVKRSRSIDA